MNLKFDSFERGKSQRRREGRGNVHENEKRDRKVKRIKKTAGKFCLTTQKHFID